SGAPTALDCAEPTMGDAVGVGARCSRDPTNPPPHAVNVRPATATAIAVRIRITAPSRRWSCLTRWTHWRRHRVPGGARCSGRGGCRLLEGWLLRGAREGFRGGRAYCRGDCLGDRRVEYRGDDVARMQLHVTDALRECLGRAEQHRRADIVRTRVEQAAEDAGEREHVV